jgi:hypothetical protein
LAVASSVVLAAAYIVYASGILMPSTKSGRISPPDFEGHGAAAAAGSQPASQPGHEFLLLSGSKSKSPLMTTPTTKLTLLPGSKAPARLVEAPAARVSLPATQPVKPVLIHGSKSGRVELSPPQYAPQGNSNPKP